MGTAAPSAFRVVSTRAETDDTRTLVLRSESGEPLALEPGQFTMLYAFGVGEAPISVSGDPDRPDELVHTVRSVGAVTTHASTESILHGCPIGSAMPSPSSMK